MKTITTSELAEKLQSGPLALFDVRGDVKYEQSHIPGARTAPLGSLTFRVASIMNKDSQIMVYSDGGDCLLAAQAVERLENLGMQNVYCYADGMAGWLEAGQTVKQSVGAKQHTWGDVVECRPIVVDRERAYNGVFKTTSTSVEGAGG